MELVDLEEDALIDDFEVSNYSTEVSSSPEKKKAGNISSSFPLSDERNNKTASEQDEEKEEEEEGEDENEDEDETRETTPDKMDEAIFEGRLDSASMGQGTLEVDRCPPVAPPSNSPSPKPTDFYIWQPMKPGYAVRMESPGLMAITRRAADHRTAVGQSESRLKQAIPAMPRLWSVVCCLLNILLPGLGTLLCGLSVLCCSRPRFVHLTRSNVIWLNAWVALLQLLTTVLLLFGWVWSIVWGVNFIIVSNRFTGNSSNSQGSVSIVRSGGHHRAPVPVDRSAANPCMSFGTAAASSPSSIPGTETLLRGDSAAQLDPPIIVLHEAPFLLLRPSSIVSPTDTVTWQPPSRSMNHHHQQQRSTGSRRNDRRRGRQNTAELLRQRDYPEMLLSPGALETIVIHHGAYFIQGQYPSESLSPPPPHPHPPPPNSVFSLAVGGGGGGGDDSRGQQKPSTATRTTTTTTGHR